MTPATHLHLSVIVSIPKILVSPPKTFLRFWGLFWHLPITGIRLTGLGFGWQVQQ
jgi:hypothetical protein